MLVCCTDVKLVPEFQKTNDDFRVFWKFTNEDITWNYERNRIQGFLKLYNEELHNFHSSSNTGGVFISGNMTFRYTPNTNGETENTRSQF
jgi:hypothetical protein